MFTCEHERGGGGGGGGEGGETGNVTGQRLLLVSLSRKIWYRIFTCEHEHGKQEKRKFACKH